MKQSASIFVLLVLTGTAVLAQDPVSVLAEGNRLYQDGEFAGARDAYELILSNGYESGTLYYNLGNAYFKLGNIPKAILNYERGARLLPDDEDLKFNLEMARLMTIDKVEPLPRLFVWDYWDGIKGWFSPDGILWTAWAAYVLVFSALSLVVISASYAMRKSALVAAAASGLAFLILLVIAVGRFSDLSREDMAIVVSELVNVKNSPDVKSTDAFVLHGGSKVQVTDRVGEWIEIRLSDGKVGWMESGAVEGI
jgi:tetratricopeptide (TPR) repeat protein